MKVGEDASLTEKLRQFLARCGSGHSVTSTWKQSFVMLLRFYSFLVSYHFQEIGQQALRPYQLS